MLLAESNSGPRPLNRRSLFEVAGVPGRKLPKDCQTVHASPVVPLTKYELGTNDARRAAETARSDTVSGSETAGTRMGVGAIVDRK